MAGLVNYGSSDEEDNTVAEDRPEVINPKLQLKSTEPAISDAHATDTSTNGKASNITASAASPSIVGHVLGPTMPITTNADSPPEDQSLTPSSPYSANRAALRDLTLPSVPNYDIPPSPPGSPNSSTNAKFKHFLELKKRGIHFNDKLSKSSALKNPSVMQQLMDFSDIDDESQFATTLAKELWDPLAFPESAYKESLSKSQQKILKKREDEKARGTRESVDFVAATVSGETSRSGTPRVGQQSAAERIMAGLDRGHSSSPQVQGVKRKTRFEG